MQALESCMQGNRVTCVLGILQLFQMKMSQTALKKTIFSLEKSTGEKL